VIAISGALIAFALWNFSWAYHGQKYEFLPQLHEFALIVDEWEDNQFEERLKQAIIEAADSNTEANDTRQTYLERGNLFMLVSVVAATVCGGIYVVDQILKG